MDISNFTLLLREAWSALDSEGILKIQYIPINKSVYMLQNSFW